MNDKGLRELHMKVSASLPDYITHNAFMNSKSQYMRHVRAVYIYILAYYYRVPNSIIARDFKLSVSAINHNLAKVSGDYNYWEGFIAEMVYKLGLQYIEPYKEGS